ncbi:MULTISPECIES: hypothetical protein [unclassified Amycolatopsis]|uniref:hypothetical protein n=1 Tax=unclassified Amycolatopsis TaxID=2618356 RepID=UPI0012907ED9|nr:MULTISPECIES: hypothetical protein [unclassified Amycolatopsis]MBN6033735.1 hypothetical protein [Amycolatopsis sp. 195334CR]QFU87128.1 hypothetical protein YIM_09600 [Amycolatopsis sp. YIM 10]
MSKKNQIRGLIALGTSAASATSAFSGVRKAREDKDKLTMVNAVASAVVAITGALLAVRTLRKDGKK